MKFLRFADFLSIGGGLHLLILLEVAMCLRVGGIVLLNLLLMLLETANRHLSIAFKAIELPLWAS